MDEIEPLPREDSPPGIEELVKQAAEDIYSLVENSLDVTPADIARIIKLRLSPLFAERTTQ